MSECMKEYTHIRRDNALYYVVLTGFVALSIAIGFIHAGSVQPILKGLVVLTRHHGQVPTDAFAIGGIGAAFVNSGLVALLGVIAYLITGTKIGSGEISAMMMMYGYAFYGKTVFNVIPLMLGVYIYAYIVGEPLNKNSFIACYTTALGPVVSTIAFHLDIFKPGSPLAISLGILAGIASGAMVGILIKHMRLLIRGNSVYVAGFTCGVVGVLVNSVMKAMGLGHGPYLGGSVVNQSYKWLLVLYLFIMFSYFIVVGFAMTKNITYSIKLLFCEHTKRDYVSSHGFAYAIQSVGLMGILALLYFIIMPGSIMHGQMWAGMFTMASFSVVGMTPRYLYPFVVGMVGTSFLSGGISGLVAGDSFLPYAMDRISSTSTMMSTYVGCGISPLTEKFGFFRAALMGVIFSVIAPNLAALQGWMNTYNNGFAIGLVVILYFTGDFKLMKAEAILAKRLVKYGLIDKIKED